MTFYTGQPKAPKAGRKKGTLNKKTQDLMELTEKLNCNPFEVLLHFANGDYKALGYEETKTKIAADGTVFQELTIAPELRQKSAKDACEYLFPKRKAIEHTGANGEKLIGIEDYLKSIKE